MMKRIGAAVAAISLAAAPAVAGVGHVYASGSLRISELRIEPTPRGASTAAGYLTIKNTGAAADRLVAASSPDAAEVEIHKMSTMGGVMRMRAVTGGLLIGPGQTLKLLPGGYHLMLVHPTHAFKAGEHVPMTLRFERSGEVPVEFDVRSGEASSGSMAGMNMP